MKYNFSDSAIRVVLIFFLIPLTGSRGYICVLFFSTIFNASLSIHRLIKVAQVEIRLLDWILKPALCGGIAVLTMTLLAKLLPTPMLGERILCTLQILGAGLLYSILLRISGSICKEDLQWLRSIVWKRTGKKETANP